MCCLLFPSREDSLEACPRGCTMGLVLGTLGNLGLCVSGSALWGAMTVFPTRGHCGSRTSRGSQSVLQLGGLSEDQTFGVPLLGPNCVPLVSKREMKDVKHKILWHCFPR